MERQCSNCGRRENYKALGLCGACYKRQRTNGSLEYKPHAGGRRKSKIVCLVENCTSTCGDSGLCISHYKRKWSTGETELVPSKRSRKRVNEDLSIFIKNGKWLDLIVAIKSRCEIDQNGCWISWQVGKNGYGRITIDSKRVSLHRLMVIAVNNGIDPGAESVHHKCSNRSCCNPEHVQQVTQRENIAEMLERKFYINKILELETRILELEMQTKETKLFNYLEGVFG